jgi:membrane fusion protein (multidrug efflux system)
MDQISSRSARTTPSGGSGPAGPTVADDAASAGARGEFAETREAPDIAAPSRQLVVSGRAVRLRLRRRQLRTLLMSAGILAVAVAAGFFWLRGGRYASTDDAYVHASKLMVTTDVSGIVSSIEVHEGQIVRAGDVLFRVDPRQFQIALDNANANLAQTVLTIEAMKRDYRRILSDVAAQQAQVDLDQVTYERYATLVTSDVVSRANYDQARFTLDADKNRLQSLREQASVQIARLGGDPDIETTRHPQYLQAKAQVDEAQRQLDHAVVCAPYDGIVTQVDALQRGTYLVSQTAALTNVGAIALVSTDNVWVDANMKETDLTYVAPGNHVDVAVDTYPGVVWSGTVESVAPASGAEFSILPAQNTSGNWVKVVQRIPVRIRIDRNSARGPLRSGMTVTVEIDTGHHRTLSELLW